MTELTSKQEQDILRAIPNPKDLEELLEDEDTEKNGEARKVALLLFEKRIIAFLNENKDDILGGKSVSFGLITKEKGDSILLGFDMNEAPTKYDIKLPTGIEMLQEVAEEVQRILVEKTYTVSCEIKAGNWREIIIQRAPSLK